MTAVRLAVLVAILLVVQGCGSSGDSSEPAQVSIPSVTAPSIAQPDAQTTTTNAEVAPKPSVKSAVADNTKSSQKSAEADNPASGTEAGSDQNKAKGGGSGGSGGGNSNAAGDAQRAGSGAQSGTPESTAQAESTAKADKQHAGG